MKKIITVILILNLAFVVSHAQNTNPTSFSEIEIGAKGFDLIKAEPVTPRNPSRAPLGLVYYSDRGVFDLANPGLPIEDWASSILGAGGVCTDLSPLNSTNVGSCFSSGDILSGIEFNTSTIDDYALLTTGYIGVPFNVVGPNTFSDDSQFIFDPPVSAIGMDIVIPSGIDALNIDIYDENGVLLGSTTSPAVAQSFWGVSSNTPIGKVEFSGGNSGTAETFGNIAFGNSVSVPISNWAIVIGLLLIGTFIVVRYRTRLA
jgi:hypothetical protein